MFAANPALANATSEGKEAFVRLMLRYQPDLPRRVDFPSCAAGAKTRELNELLFRHRMNPSAPNWLGIKPLHEIARQGNVEKAPSSSITARTCASDEEICSTPLGWAAKFGCGATVDFLLRRGARPNLPDNPPWATRRAHSGIAAPLKERGAK